MKILKLTRAQYLVLRNIRDHGFHAATGFYGASRRGGATKSVDSMRRRGLVDGPHRSEHLTAEGKRFLKEFETITDEQVEEHCKKTWPRFPEWHPDIQEKYRRTARRTLLVKRLK